MIATLRALTLILICGCATAGATDYPAGPVKIIHPYPGGLLDLAARALAEKLAVEWKQPVLVEQKPGANELIAGDAVAKASPDGQTIFVGSESSFTNNPFLFAKMAFDPLVDLVPVTELFEIRFGLVVRGDLPVRNLTEFIALMKKDGGKYSYASSGAGGPLHLAMEDFRQTVGFEMVHVPYKVLPQVMQDILGGRVDALFVSAASVLQFLPSGRLKILAVTGNKRLKGAPDVATFAELGFPNVNYKTSVGVAVPKGTAPATIAKIQTDIRTVLMAREFTDKVLTPNDLEAIGSDPRQFSELLAQRRQSAQKLIKALNVRLD